MVVSGFSINFWGARILIVLLSPVVFFLYVLISRIWLELIIVVFRIAENTGSPASVHEQIETDDVLEDNNPEDYNTETVDPDIPMITCSNCGTENPITKDMCAVCSKSLQIEIRAYKKSNRGE